MDCRSLTSPVRTSLRYLVKRSHPSRLPTTFTCALYQHRETARIMDLRRVMGKGEWLPWRVKVKVTQSCPTLCDPMGYTVHGILQARTLEWVASPFSRGSSQPRNQARVSCIVGGFLPAELSGKPYGWSGTWRGVGEKKKKQY